LHKDTSNDAGISACDQQDLSVKALLAQIAASQLANVDGITAIAEQIGSTQEQFRTHLASFKSSAYEQISSLKLQLKASSDTLQMVVSRLDRVESQRGIAPGP